MVAEKNFGRHQWPNLRTEAANKCLPDPIHGH
jgi:hypothetical protein